MDRRNKRFKKDVIIEDTRNCLTKYNRREYSEDTGDTSDSDGKYPIRRLVRKSVKIVGDSSSSSDEERDKPREKKSKTKDDEMKPGAKASTSTEVVTKDAEVGTDVVTKDDEVKFLAEVGMDVVNKDDEVKFLAEVVTKDDDGVPIDDDYAAKILFPTDNSI